MIENYLFKPVNGIVITITFKSITNLSMNYGTEDIIIDNMMIRK